MKLAVTTSHSVLSVDVESDEVFPLHRGDGLYYGMTTNGNAILVGARGRKVSSDVLQGEESGSILFFDNTFNPLARIQPPTFSLRDIHDICWWNKRLWVTCSYDNMVAVWDGESWERWYPLGVSESQPWDQNHFNTIHFENDSMWLVAHNMGASEMLRFDAHTRQIAESILLGNQAHNLWRENGHLYTCSSGEGLIVGTDGFRLDIGGFPRGVAFEGNYRCVGVSELAERGDRDLTTGRILIFNKDWKLLKKIFIENEGLILDLKSINRLRGSIKGK
jgi:hypothetical protein